MGFTRDQLIGCLVSEDEKQNLLEICRRHGVSMSELLRQALLLYHARVAEEDKDDRGMDGNRGKA